MERVLTRIGISVKVPAWAKTIAKAVAVTLVIGSLYYGLYALDPSMQKTRVIGTIGKTIRYGTSLKALSLLNPLVTTGTSAGSAYISIIEGDSVAYFVTMIHAVMGMLFWRLSRKVGRGFWKDLSVVSLFGIVNGAIVTLKLSTVAHFLHSAPWGKLLTMVAVNKMFTSALTLIAGYFIWVIPFEQGVKFLKKRGLSEKVSSK